MDEFSYGFFEIDTTIGIKYISHFPTTKETYEKLTTLYVDQEQTESDLIYIIAKFKGDINSPKLHANKNGRLTYVPKEVFEIYKNMKPVEPEIKDEMSEKLRKLLEELKEG